MAYLLAAMMMGITLPTPLYVIYQERWHFSSWLITLIFASYAAGVLISLLLAGRSSDQVGRRPILGVAIALSALSTVVFILAPSVGWLFVGRVLSDFRPVWSPARRRRRSPRRRWLLAPGEPPGWQPRRIWEDWDWAPSSPGLFAEFGPNPTVLVFEV